MRPIAQLAAIIIAFICIGCTPRKEFREMVCYELHTPYSVKYEATQNLENDIRQVMRDYYHAINPFDSTSIISHVNRNEDIIVESVDFGNKLENSSLKNEAEADHSHPHRGILLL